MLNRNGRRGAALTGVLLLGLWFMLVPGTARAAGTVIAVNSTAGTTGGADCTLRDAIQAANTSSRVGGCDGTGGAPFTLELVPNASYSVTEVVDTNLSGYPAGLPVVTASMTINGNGATVRGSAGTPPLSLFVIYQGTLTLNDMTLTGVSTSGFQAAAGAIYNYNGGLVLNHSRIENNAAGTRGGGVQNVGTATIRDSTFTNNSASQGGALDNEGTMAVFNSTFEGNQATQGAAIFNVGTLAVTNSTFFSNTASKGGALYLRAGTAVVVNSTMAGSHADGTGSVVWSDVDGVTFKNTLIASSSAGAQCNSAKVTGTNNLSTDDSCAGFTTKAFADFALGDLADNGGLTKTVGLGAGSAAAGAGDDATCAAATGAPDYGAGGRDQRGVTRPQGAHCAVGAFEGTLAPPPSITPNAPSTGPTVTPTAPNGNPNNPANPQPNGNPNAPNNAATCPNPYLVRPGEWLLQIARKCGVSVTALAAANGIWNPNWIRSGTVLRIPVGGVPLYYGATGTTYIVHPGDTLYGIAARFGVAPWALANANGLWNPNFVYAGEPLVIPR